MPNEVKISDGADNFERLLRQHRAAEQGRVTTEPIHEDKKVSYSKADRGATVEDFITMVNKTVTKAMKKLEVQFVPDDGPRITIDPNEPLDHPVIYWTLISRLPRSNEPKPKFREYINDYNSDGSIARKGAIYGQVFDCLIQCDIVASDYALANKVMNGFEDVIFRYSGFYKENGVSEIFFSKQYTDNTLDVYRQKVSIRSLVYKVSIEKIYLSYDTVIAELDE